MTFLIKGIQALQPCGVQGRLCRKPTLIWFYSMRVSWLVNELFSSPFYIFKIFFKKKRKKILTKKQYFFVCLGFMAYQLFFVI